MPVCVARAGQVGGACMLVALAGHDGSHGCAAPGPAPLRLRVGGGGGACGGLCDAWCSRPRQGGHGSLTLSPPGECSVWTRRLPVIDMLPAAPRLHEARGRAPWAHDWGGPHLLTALGTGGVVVDWTLRPRR